MARFLRNRKIIAIGTILVLLASVTVARANVRFFLQVMRNLQHYRVTGDSVDMNLEGKGTGNLEFILNLPSRRNNFEEVIMAGYLSVAYAIDRTGLMVKRVYVNVTITKADGRLISTWAPATELAKLVSQEVGPHDFLRALNGIN